MLIAKKTAKTFTEVESVVYCTPLAESGAIITMRLMMGFFELAMLKN